MSEPARVLLRLPADLHALLTQRAAAEGVSFNTYAVALLAGGVGFGLPTNA
jgi:predicted HicB family RNase H-like nuclease